MWFALALLPPIAIQLYDGWSLFAISVWLVPAMAAVLVAFAFGSTVAWLALLGAGVTGWLLCMYEWASQVHGRFVRRLADGLLLRTLPPDQRAAYRGFLLAHRGTPQSRQAIRQLDDPARTTRALRQVASEVLQLDSPDANWGEVFQASAAVHLRYAEMLEGVRPLDYDAVKALAKSRDELLIALLREESRVYRMVNYSPIRREHTLRPE
jgi:hypothetical protein